jgi:hypothetical protein
MKQRHEAEIRAPPPTTIVIPRQLGLGSRDASDPITSRRSPLAHRIQPLSLDTGSGRGTSVRGIIALVLLFCSLYLAGGWN